MAHLRAVLIALHILTVILLSLPSSRQMLQREVWDRPSNQRAFEVLADRFSFLGFQSGKDFDHWLWNIGEHYVGARDTIVEPFVVYADLAGARQGWAMFSRPRERPIELQISVAERYRYQTVYQTGSSEYDFLAGQLRQYRVRKVTGRLARHFDRAWYDPLTERLATEVALLQPDARRIRFRLYRYTTLPPEAVRAGEQPVGAYRDRRNYDAEALR
ncbi:MAG: hypothetical protein AAF997_12025 [Myxococcota bacterium]